MLFDGAFLGAFLAVMELIVAGTLTWVLRRRPHGNDE